LGDTQKRSSNKIPVAGSAMRFGFYRASAVSQHNKNTDKETTKVEQGFLLRRPATQTTRMPLLLLLPWTQKAAGTWGHALRVWRCAGWPAPKSVVHRVGRGQAATLFVYQLNVKRILLFN
jgi:hypothetical protein